MSPASDPASTPPGTYWVFARITDGVRSRYLYAPQKLVLGSSRQPPILTSARVTSNQFHVTVSGIAGQTIVIQASTNLVQWSPIQTNLMTGPTWNFTDPASASLPLRNYRARLLP